MKRIDVLFTLIVGTIIILVLLTITGQYQAKQVKSAKTLEQQIIDKLKDKDSWQKAEGSLKLLQH